MKPYRNLSGVSGVVAPAGLTCSAVVIPAQGGIQSSRFAAGE